MTINVTDSDRFSEAYQDCSITHTLDVDKFSEFIFDQKFASHEPILNALPKAYQITKLLGEGSFGMVYKAEKTADKTQAFAIKFYNSTQTERFTKDVSQQKYLHKLAPALVMPILDEGFMTIKDTQFTGSSAYFVTNCFGMDLLKIFGRQGNFRMEFSDILTIFYKSLKLYKILDDAEISLRDCKPGNILLDREFDLRFIDISIGKYGSIETTYSGRYYRSPYEYLKLRHRSETPLALGATFYLILTGKVLFYSKQTIDEFSFETITGHLNSIFSFIGPPSQSLVDQLRKKLHRSFFEKNKKSGTYQLKDQDDLQVEQTREKVLYNIKKALANRRFPNTFGNIESLANDLFELIQGLTNIEAPWSPEKALSMGHIREIADRETTTEQQNAPSGTKKIYVV